MKASVKTDSDSEEQTIVPKGRDPAGEGVTSLKTYTRKGTIMGTRERQV